MTVDSFENGASFHIWGGFLPAVVPVGESMIFTQTGSYNFDSSDQPIHDLPASSAQPVVHVVVDSVSAFFTDTAQVLNTEGSDHLALTNQNESHIWREIGTFGGVPEPSSLVLLGLGGSALVARAWWRRRLAARS
ncbi:MAG: PEP-CTERM sorting domain-containing protein [Planctomycetia bacterium]|nr:PEP-CTERM sorting domain-containing protein [Planctomycetia bacterium]